MTASHRHRHCAAPNAHLHFHFCIIDGVFEASHAADAAAEVVFHEASGLAAAAVASVQAQVRRRVLRARVRCGLLEQNAGDQMGGWAHGGGFSLDAAVRIEGADRAGGSGCCVTSPARRSPWNICTNTTLQIWSTTSPNRAPTDSAPWC